MVSIAIEIGIEVAEIGEIVAESAEIAEVAATAADTTEIVGEALQIATLETSLETTIGDEVSGVITDSLEEDISGELEQIVDESSATGEGTDPAGEDSTAGEDGKTKPSMLKVIGKWANRILNTYMLMDMVAKKIMSIIDEIKGGGGGGAQPKLTEEQKKTLTDLSTAVQKMSIIYNSLKDSVKTISDSTDFLGNETVTEHGTTATVKEVFDSILVTINQKFTICHTIVSRTPFKSSDITDLGDAVYQAILRMNALFELKAKSKALTAFDVPSKGNRTTLNEILKLKFVTSKDSNVKKIKAIVDNPQTKAHAKTAAVSAASAVIHADVVRATKEETIKVYQPEAKRKAKSAAKDAGESKARSYIPKYIAESQIPFFGSELANKVKRNMKSAAKGAAEEAARKTITAYFQSSSVKAGIARIAKEQTIRYAKLEHKQIVRAADNAARRSVQTTLKQAHLM